MPNKTILREKLNESISSVLPIALIVALMCLSFVPVTTDLMLAFLLGTIMLIVGMGLFTLGAEASMTQIGTHTGARMTKTRRLWLILALSFILGVAITVAEPDLQVLASNVPHINTTVLIITVSVGVGLFLVVCMLRILLGIQLRWVLLGCYIIVFALAALSEAGFLSVAFDSGGVTTGPMTVPFIMALGVGVASIRSDKNAEADSFGLVALCSVGPILAVMLLGFFYEMEDGTVASSVIHSYANTVELGGGYLRAIPEYMGEVALALAPIVGFFLLFQVFALHLRRVPFLKIIIGLVYTYVGLVLFLVGVNVGFSSLGTILGAQLAIQTPWLLVPIAMVMGWFIISAEPAVHVLNKQVEDVTGGTVSQSMMNTALSIGVACAVMLSMVRVLTGISIYWILVPGYALALILARFVPSVFVGIAFDSGGVASGPMTSTFLLPLAMGACTALDGNVVTDAFGVVALVALAPPVAIQIMGVIYVHRAKAVAENKADLLPDDGVIDLEDEEI